MFWSPPWERRESASPFSRAKRSFRPYPPTTWVDPTGAGDAFRGGLILGLVHPVNAAHANEGGSFTSITLRQLERAAQIGSACAHFAIQQPGTQEYRYTREELDAVLERAYGG